MDILKVPSCDIIHGVPASHYQCHFSNFDFGGNEDLKRITTKFLNGDKFWLYLHGQTGRGKTHYAVSLYRALVAKLGYAGADSASFAEWESVASDFRASIKGFEYDSLMEAYSECEALVLDDVTGTMKDFSVKILEDIVRRRHAMGRRLVITSNEGYEKFLSLFGEHEVSRIRSVCVAVQFIGLDRRLA